MKRISPHAIRRINEVARRRAVRLTPPERELMADTILDFSEEDAECGLLDASFDEEGAP